MFKSKIVRNSGIYSVLNLFQKGINFLLVPVLTAYLTTFDYGVIAVVTAVNAFLNVFYLLSLNGCLNRFYYEYKDDENKVKRLFGTIITFVLVFSTFLSIILGFGHKYFIDPFLSDIDFFPYMFIGMISVLFNPVFTIYQNTLQAKQEGKQFGKNNLLFFVINLSFLLTGVIFLKLKAIGVIGALALTNVIFFIYTISRFGKDMQIGIDAEILKESLKYSLPLVPHSLSGVATNIIDRLFINNMLTTSLAGIYSLGNTFGGVIFLIASGVNQAFVPWFNEKVKKGDYCNIPKVATYLVVFYCTIALGLTLFGKDIIFLITPESYHKAWTVIPYISFAFVLHSIYYFFSTPLFYNISGKGNRILPLFTIATAILNIVLNILLIDKYGIIGASVATLLSKLVLVLGLSKVYKKFVNINYQEKVMLLLPIVYFIVALIGLHAPYIKDVFVNKLLVYCCILLTTFFFFKKDLVFLVKGQINNER